MLAAPGSPLVLGQPIDPVATGAGVIPKVNGIAVLVRLHLPAKGERTEIQSPNPVLRC